MKTQVIYKYLDVPTQYEQKMGGQLIVEIDGKKYRCIFRLDAAYPGQSAVSTSLFTKDEGWHVVHSQSGIENTIVNHFHRMTPPHQGASFKSGSLKAQIESEMMRLCKLAAKINS